MIKNIIAITLAHVLMPFIVTASAAFLIIYWSVALFDFDPFVQGHSVITVFWTIFFLSHVKLAFDWWLVRDL